MTVKQSTLSIFKTEDWNYQGVSRGRNGGVWGVVICCPIFCDAEIISSVRSARTAVSHLAAVLLNLFCLFLLQNAKLNFKLVGRVTQILGEVLSVDYLCLLFSVFLEVNLREDGLLFF